MSSILIPTPIGVLYARAGSQALLGVDLLLMPEGVAEEPNPLLRDLSQKVDQYFAGQAETFAEVELELAGYGPRHIALYQAVRQIPFGQTRSYGEVGQLCGLSPTVVSVALQACPFFLIVPTQRVIYADGSLGGVMGREGVKEWLLKHEGAWPE